MLNLFLSTALASLVPIPAGKLPPHVILVEPCGDQEANCSRDSKGHEAWISKKNKSCP